MTVAMPREAVAWSQRALFAVAFLLLGYCGFTLLDGWIFENRQRQEFARLLSERHRTAAAAVVSTPIASGGLIGHIEIPRLGVSAILIEGTSWATLQRAVGHIKGTARPGQAGNVGISGHRDTFFRPLRNIHRDDVITLTTLEGKFNYRVVSTQVVGPEVVSVLDPGENETLTLVTCHPFYFVGPAPGRFIVKAERLKQTTTRSASAALQDLRAALQ